MKKMMCSCIALLLSIALLIPMVACAEPRMDGNMYCTRCGSVCETLVDGGGLSARRLTCPDCGTTDDFIQYCLEYYYACTNCSYTKLYKTVRYYECTGCGNHFNP